MVKIRWTGTAGVEFTEGGKNHIDRSLSFETRKVRGLLWPSGAEVKRDKPLSRETAREIIGDNSWTYTL